MTRRRAISGLVLAALMATPLSARADVGIPVAVVFWPATWVLLLPVVVIEAFVARRILGLSLRQGLKLSLKANAWSTLAGVPLACLLMLKPGLVAGRVGAGRAGWLAWLSGSFLGSAVWLDGTPDWALFAGPALLCVPCYFLSVWIETWSAETTVPRADARKWAVTANRMTYGVLFGLLLVAALTVASR
jgi:hypothetical protein